METNNRYRCPTRQKVAYLPPDMPQTEDLKGGGGTNLCAAALF
jgi:hypothetical protein